MPQYDLHVLCSECGKFHDVLLRLSLDQSFEVRNVRDLYDGEIPPEFYAAIADQNVRSRENRLGNQIRT